MFGSGTLDVVVGILFVYFVLSLVCSALQEIIAALLRLRPRFLDRGIRTLLGDPLARDFYNHSLIKPLLADSRKPDRVASLPSYIPKRAFALALMDLIAPGSSSGYPSGVAGATITSPTGFSSTTPTGFPAVGPRPWKEAVTTPALQSVALAQAIPMLSDAAGGDPVGIRQNVEQWYDNVMGNVASAYKRRTQWMIGLIALMLAIALNADTILLIRTLSSNSTIRESIGGLNGVPTAQPCGNATGGSAAGSPAAMPSQGQRSQPTTSPPRESSGTLGSTVSTGPASNAPITSSTVNLNSGIQFGWRNVPRSGADWFQKILGILLTVMAISLGAPFWFDVLNRVTVVRSAIKPCENRSGHE